MKLEPGSSEWKSARKQGLGSSDMKDLLELKPYGCPRKLVYDKSDIPPDWAFTGNRYTVRGHKLEDVVAREFAEDSGWKLTRAEDQDAIGNAAAKELRESYFWLKSNIDRRITLTDEQRESNDAAIPDGPGVAEIKTVGKTAWERLEREGVMAHTSFADWYYQVQHQLAFTGWEWGMVVACHPDEWQFSQTLILRDEFAINEILKAGSKLWAKVMIQRALPAGEFTTVESMPRLKIKDNRCRSCPWRQKCHGEDWTDFIGGGHEEGMGIFGDDEKWKNLSERYQLWKSVDDEHQENIAEIKTAIKALIGDQRIGAEGAGLKVYWKSQVSKRFDTSRFKKEHPALADGYLKETTTRPLRIYTT